MGSAHRRSVLPAQQLGERLAGAGADGLVFVLFFEGIADLLDLGIGLVLDPDEAVARAVERADKLVELGLHRRGVAILRILDQEYHQKGDDRRSRIHAELPGDRRSAVEGKSVAVMVNIVGGRIIKKKKQ